MAGCGDVDRASNMLPGGRKINESCSNTAPSLNVPECAICLQTCVHPVKLPCKHIFCFLCVKGASWQSRRCALCRQEIPEDFLDKPALLSPEELKAASRGNGEYAWYYEGRNGWWQYDERTSLELEDAYLKGKKTIEMLIAGFLYVADLENMVQFRRNEHGRRRKIKRDIVDIPKKGVAGLRLDCDSNGLSSERENSADGADSAADTGSTAASVQPSVATIRPSVMPTMAIPGQPLTLSPDTTVPLVSSFTQLQLQDQSTARSRRGEGEEQEDLVPTSRVITSQSAASLLYDGTESGTSSDSEDENTIQLQQSMSTNHSRQRLVPPSLERENEIPGGEPSLEEPSTSVGVREQQPDGQCTVTEV